MVVISTKMPDKCLQKISNECCIFLSPAYYVPSLAIVYAQYPIFYVSDEASPTFRYANANFSVFIEFT